jgi:NADPH-dependent 2,4-dienoyl-CoA reductase/sulfur reductase-like enzyme
VSGPGRSSKRRLVVVGGVAAGLSAALRARRLEPDLDVAVFERTGYCAYSACGLPYLVAGAVADHRALVARTPADLAKEGVAVALHHEVTEVDAAAGQVRVRDLDTATERAEPYDALLLATGGRARIPFPGMDLPGAFFVRTVEDSLAIRAALDSERPSRAVVAGGGYIGLEMAEALRARGVATTVVEMLPRVLPLVDAEIAADVEAELARHGVEVRTSTRVEAVEGDVRVRRVVVSGAGGTGTEAIDADLVVVGVGVSPDTSLAAAAGVPLGARGAVAVDGGMRTGTEGVWAAGDCAETRHRLHDGPAYVPLGTTANKQGRVAGATIAGREETFAGVVGTAALKVFDLQVARTGLSEAEAAQAGLEAVGAAIVHRSRAGYYPGAVPLRVKLVVERGGGRLLGAQLAGTDGTALRIDVVAAALHADATVDDLAAFDLAYAPPFAPVWDPLLIAAREAGRLA